MNDVDLGEMQEVQQGFVITKANVVNKEVYCNPKNFAERYDGYNLWFNVTIEAAENRFDIRD